ncbi:MAG: hypothetical protein JXA54_06920 [Candidatus Heimdallarchaeota archaeon]|nr:hypothetical protein [Candidatus Heimdallarchaeota archaeon]
MRKITRKHWLLFAFVLCLIIPIAPLNTKALNTSINNTFTTHSTQQLKIYDFPQYSKPIYANYTALNITVQLLGTQASLSEVYSYYSYNHLNWTKIKFNKILTIADDNVLFSGALGPFDYDGEYFLKINASRVVETAKLTYRFTVQPVSGIVFVDFSYKFKTLSDTNQYADVFINILGSDIKLGSVYVSSTQQEEGESPFKMNLIADSNITYRASIGPTNRWSKFFSITFSANTSTNAKFNSNEYFLLKETTNYVPEYFWTGKFPAIVVSAIVFCSLAMAFIMSKRKPPRKFDSEDKELKRKSTKKEVKKEKED